MSELSSFVDTLRHTGLLDDRQVEALQSSIIAANPQTLANELVRRNWLTDYQGEQVAQGKAASLVLGQYILLDQIGAGGMGQVFKARHRLMARIVALKVIRKDQLLNPQAIERFHREIRAVAQLSHPNVVLAHDADQVGDTHFFVMEYVEGIDLGKRTKKEGPPAVGLACDWIRQAAVGLQHAHEKGLVHRDIKPSNLLLTATGVVKVLDLGLARLRQEAEQPLTLTEEGAVMGTPDFMAPEQAQDSRKVDIRADLYSLGCTLFYLLTARPVFPAETGPAKLYKHWFEEPEPVERLRPEVPAEVAAIVRRLLAKKPADRYQTPAELAEALAPYCTPTHQPVAAERESAGRFDTVAPSPVPSGTKPEKPSSWKSARTESRTVPTPAGKRKPLAVAAVLAVIVMMALGCLLLVSSGQQTEPEAQPVQAPVTVEIAKSEPSAPVVDAQEPVIHRDEEPPAAVAPRPRQAEHHALLIGVGRYEAGELAGLPYADADMRQLAAALPVAGYRPENVSTVEPARALDIRRELHRLKQRSPHDSVILAFAGQVIPLADEYCLCPADARSDDRQTLISMSELYAALRNCPARFKLLIVDAFRAESGSISSSIPLERPVPPDGVAVLWSCSAGEVAHDFPERKQGLFGYWLAEGLRDHATNLEGFIQRKVFASAVQHRRRGQMPDRLGVTGGPAPVPGLESFTAPPPLGEIAVLSGHAEGINSVAISPHGLVALSCSTDSTVRLWDLESRREERALDPDVVSVPWSVAFSSDGKLALIGTGGVKEEGRLKPGSPFHNTLRIWDAVSYREVKQLQGHGDYVTAVACSADGKLAASGSVDRTVRLWNINNGKELGCCKGHSGRVRAVAFAPDGKQVASAAEDGTVRLWSLAGKEVWSFTSAGGTVTSLSFSPDGQHLAAAGSDGNIRILDRQSGQELRILTGHTGGVNGVAFAPHGQRLVSAGSDKTVRLWDAESSQELTSFKGHTEAVTAVAFGPDGRQVISGSQDRTVRLWALPRH